MPLASSPSMLFFITARYGTLIGGACPLRSRVLGAAAPRAAQHLSNALTPAHVPPPTRGAAAIAARWLRQCRVSCPSLPMHEPHGIPDDEVNVSQIHLITGFIEAECSVNC